MSKYQSPMFGTKVPAVVRVSRAANLTIVGLCLFALYSLLAIYGDWQCGHTQKTNGNIFPSPRIKDDMNE